MFVLVRSQVTRGWRWIEGTSGVGLPDGEHLAGRLERPHVCYREGVALV